MVKRLKPIIYSRVFILLAYYIVRLYSKTFRLTVVNEDLWRHSLEENPVILCAWHQQFFAAIHHFKRYAHLNPGLMISQSRDGELISGVARRTGWRTPRGSSSKGGREALNVMIDHIRTYGLGAHVLDGPRGPMGIVKPGIVKMAMETGAAVVPFYTRADRAWFFNSWDRFMLPKPFSKVTLEFDEPIPPVPLANGSDDNAFETYRKELESRMHEKLFLG